MVLGLARASAVVSAEPVICTRNAASRGVTGLSLAWLPSSGRRLVPTAGCASRLREALSVGPTSRAERRAQATAASGDSTDAKLHW